MLVGQGIRDLFLMPVDEYRKDDGHIVKGLQKGAESFGISTASAAVDIAQRMVGLVQVFNSCYLIFLKCKMFIGDRLQLYNFSHFE